MNCLPVVSRELRVAARKRSTFWLRVAAAVTGLALGSGCMLISLMRGVTTTQMGSVLFYALTWMCLAAVLCAGLFFTSDCLSEEKREGTLGLLFLTELRGHDVVLGKLLATSLRGFYAVLAVLPVLSVTLLMGGITGAEYWKSSLALVNALLCSLAAGMFISAISRDSQKALAGTLFVLLLFVFAGLVADATLAGVTGRGFRPIWSVSSPGYVLLRASDWGRSAYWSALLVGQLLCWLMFGLACVLVPRTWQDRKRAGASAPDELTYRWKYGGAARRARLRRALLDRQPIAWLACRERWQSVGLWVMALLTVSGFVTALLVDESIGVAWIAWGFVGVLFTFLVYIWTASQACRFFVEARRSGLLELLLAAPVTEAQLLGGQWRALLRMFGLPVLLLLSVQMGGSLLSQRATQRITRMAAPVVSTTGTNQSGAFTNGGFVVTTTVAGPATAQATQKNITVRPGLPFQFGAAQVSLLGGVASACAGLSMAGNLLALCWFGMWMGLTSRTANLATLKTLLFVQVIPALVIRFGMSMVGGMFMAGLLFKAGLAQSSSWFIWYTLLNTVGATGLSLAKDVGFILWSRKRLYASFREQASRSFERPANAALPPPLPGSVPPPPVIRLPG